MRRHLMIAGTIVLASAGSACSELRAESAGPSTSRSYQVGGFTGLEVAGPFDVKVTTGKAVSVAATGPQKLLDATEVLVENGKLLIRSRKGGWPAGLAWGTGDNVLFTVSVPSLASAEMAGSGDIDIDRVSGERFAATIAGSGNLRLPQVSVRELTLAVAGSGEVEAAGQAERARYEIAGSGDLDASRLTAVDARVEVAGSGHVKARVTSSARASVAGSGEIDISGGASCETSKAGSGDIRCD